MTSEDDRLVEAAAFGRRMADETIALVAKSQAEHEQMMAMLRHQAPAPPARRADLGEALRQLYEGRSPRLNRPTRPHLVIVTT